MKKNFLTRINLWLSSVSVALAGCHVQKQVVEPVPDEPSTPVVEKPREPDPPQCLYGPPPGFYDDEPQPRKYGPPPTVVKEEK